MQASVEISLYPLKNDFIPVIKAFIERLNSDPRLRVETNTMSTQVFGRYEDLMQALTTQIAATFEHDGKAVVVLKVLGPLCAS